MDASQPIYLIGGSKGGVGKSMVTLALADYLQRHVSHAAMVETDTSNPDVMKAPRDEMMCASYDLDDADGWIGFVNFCDTHRGGSRDRQYGGAQSDRGRTLRRNTSADAR